MHLYSQYGATVLDHHLLNALTTLSMHRLTSLVLKWWYKPRVGLVFCLTDVGIGLGGLL